MRDAGPGGGSAAASAGSGAEPGGGSAAASDAGGSAAASDAAPRLIVSGCVLASHSSVCGVIFTFIYNFCIAVHFMSVSSLNRRETNSSSIVLYPVRPKFDRVAAPKFSGKKRYSRCGDPVLPKFDTRTAPIFPKLMVYGSDHRN